MKTALWLFGTELNIIKDEKETDGRYDLIHGSFAPGMETPLHLHSKYSELIYVLEGEFTVYTKDQVSILHSGQSIFVPVGEPHSVANTGTDKGKALTVASPSGFAELIRLVGLEGKSDGVPGETFNDMDLFMKVSTEIGDQIIGPPGSRP